MWQIWYRWKALSVLSTEWSHPRAKNAYCDLQRPIKADILAKYGAHSVAYCCQTLSGPSIQPYWGARQRLASLLRGQTASGNYQLTKRRPVPATSFLPIGKIPFLSKVMAVLNLRILNNDARVQRPTMDKLETFTNKIKGRHFLRGSVIQYTQI